MAEPWLGEIRIWSFDWAPRDWAFCDGADVAISSNPALFSLLGTTYGGDGVNTFALPDMRGRMPVKCGTDIFNYTYPMGSRAGVETVTLGTDNLPLHDHVLRAASEGPDTADPTDSLLASQQSFNMYGWSQNTTPMRTGSIGPNGGGQAHENMQPYLTLNFTIAMDGLYPSRN